MNRLMAEHLERLNPTGILWEDMNEEQQLELRKNWDSIVSVKRNLACTCPRAACRNNQNCKFCVLTHRYYGSLPDCLRFVDDKWSEGVPAEKRHNIHTLMTKGRQLYAANRDDYEVQINARNSNELDAETRRINDDRHEKNTVEWHELVRDPKKTVCTCSKTDCWYHGNCVKCAALHRFYNGFPDCCRDIADKIDTAVQAYREESDAVK